MDGDEHQMSGASEPERGADRVFAVRGAVQADRNDRESILGSADELIRELMRRNELVPERMISCILTCTDDLDAEFPAVAARGAGLTTVPLLCTREMDVPGSMERVIRAMVHYYAPAEHEPAAHLPRRRPAAALGPTLGPVTISQVNYAKKLEQLPHYEGGMDLERARELYETDEVIKLASNESPWGPHPAVLEKVAEAAASANRYPDQYAALLRKRIAERYDFNPDGIAVSNGSCEILLAASLALCEPGAEIIYGWPAFSMYPQMAPLSGATEIRVPLNDRYEHDLEAMLAEITVATQLVLVCNPNNPTGTYLPAERIADFCERVPDHVTVILDEAYIEIQTVDDPFATVDLLRRFPNLVLLRTFSKVYGLAGLRCGYALGSARFRAAVDAVRQPFSINLLAQAAGAEAIRHQDDVEDRVARTVAERLDVEAQLHEIGLTDRRVADELLLDLARRSRRRRGRRGARQGGRDRPRRHPARAALATSASPTARREENAKFLEALRCDHLTRRLVATAPAWYNRPSMESTPNLTFRRPRGRRSACVFLAIGDLARRPAWAARSRCGPPIPKLKRTASPSGALSAGRRSRPWVRPCVRPPV